MVGSGYFSFYNNPGQSLSRRLTTSGVTGMIVTGDGVTTEADTVQPTASGLMVAAGIITTPQGDPNNNGAFKSGDVVEVTFTGAVPVLLVDGTYAKNDQIIPSRAVPGYGKVIGTESGTLSVIGTYADAAKTLTSGGLASVQLAIVPLTRP